MKIFYLIIWILALGLLFGCSSETPDTEVTANNNDVVQNDAAVEIPKETTIALFLSNSNTPYPTQEDLVPLFPLSMEVQEAPLLYDASDIVTVLPVYGCPGGCRWLGDFTAGNVIEVITISADGNYCYASGETIQGWDVIGWVSCARLLVSSN